MQLVDPYGRKISYLRLSVTDRCNLRCSYCMPAAGVQKRGHGEILRYEELLLLARIAVALGIEKIRVTGGEPLVREGITGFLAALSGITGLRRLVLTTNGVRLEEMAAELRCAGVESLNVSVDSLRPEIFARITRGGELNKVLAGLEAAERAGFPYLKINMVVMRGVNDDELLDFALLALERPYRVRFIEYMPTIGGADWRSLVISGEEVLTRLSRRFRLLPLARESLAGPARNFRIDGGAGTVGIITPVSSHFCCDCNRIRVTSTGLAKGCLFSGIAADLKPFLAAGDETGLATVLRRVVGSKPPRHLIADVPPGGNAVAMSEVGG